VLRNGGNDDAFCRLRDGLAHTLGQEVGLLGQAFQPVTVYLNGQFQDVLNARDEITPLWLATWHGADIDTVAILTHNEYNPRRKYGNILDLADYHRIIEWVSGRDFTRDSTLDALSQWVDLDNLMMFYAFQITCGNIDWPHNNCFIWRAEGTGELTDGRWRMALKDLERSTGRPFCRTF
jgi:hypothetical protein